MEGRLARIGLRIWVAGVLLFLFVPIVIIIVYAFNSSIIQTWPIHGFSTKWFSVAWHDPQVRAALVLSLKAAVVATVIALLLGSLAAFGVHRFRFFGRESVSLLLVLPLALPGIITGIALNSAFSFAGIDLSLLTIIIGHATFCIVVVYNNVLARLRRMSGSMYEASADLGAHGWFAFRTVTLPMLVSVPPAPTANSSTIPLPPVCTYRNRPLCDADASTVPASVLVAPIRVSCPAGPAE